MDLPLAFDSQLFVQLTVNGLTLGSLYALIAIGYSLVYGILKLLNFAHGDVYMVGAFVGYGILTAFDGPLSPNIALVPLIALMFLVAMLACGALGVVIERFAYRPLRTLPAGAADQRARRLLLPPEQRPAPARAEFRSYDSFLLGSDHPELFVPGPLVDALFVVNGVNVQRVQVLVMAMTVALMVALTVLVARSKLGKAMRATARSTARPPQ